jgi:hypothetical protein
MMHLGSRYPHSYLRATKWVQAEAINRLEGTLKWKREFGFYDKMTPEHIEPEVRTLLLLLLRSPLTFTQLSF